MGVELRDYQERGVRLGVEHAEGKGFPRKLLASPTGTGKSWILLTMQSRLPGSWILTPRLEIARGFLEKLGHEVPRSEGKLAAKCLEHKITTPTRFRNMLEQGHEAPRVVLMDEVHHAVDSATTTGDLFALLPAARWIGLTATPFRGTPRGTAQLVADWGEPEVLLTVLQAIEAGYMARPTFDVVPLFDDDQLEVVNGEFVVVEAEQSLLSELEALAALVVEERVGPTAVAVPGSNIAAELRSRLALLGVRADWVNQATPTSERADAYARCKAGESVLIDIATLTEGVDFPWLRTLIDAQPTLSPVRWMQRIGRIMRPGHGQPRYVCTNRNLERHSYLMQGGVPRRDVLAAMKAFGQVSSRLTKRVGLESLHKFKCVEIPTHDDGVGLMYSLTSNDRETGLRTDRVVILDAEKTYCGEAVHDRRADKWGRYKRCSVWSDMTGFRSKSPSRKPRPGKKLYPENDNLTVKQGQWWTRAAGRHGLDPAAVSEIDARQFDALPALSQMGLVVGE